MKNYGKLVEKNRNPNWPYISENPDRIWIVGGSLSGKNNLFLTLITCQRPDIDKYWQILTSQRSIRFNLSITYQRVRKSRK